MRKLSTLAVAGLVMISMLAIGPMSMVVKASSHREAPSTSVDPEADGTDMYVFRDPNDPTMITMIANFIPFQLPQGGPNFYRFDDNITYAIRVDNNGDAVTDIQYLFNFQTTVANPNSFLYNTGPVTSLTSSNLNIKQTYTLTVVRGNAPNTTSEVVATGVPVPPVNIGPRSTPNYEANLAQPSIKQSSSTRGTITSFVGQRDEGFFVDVGSIFDLLGLRPFNANHVAPLPTAPGVGGTAGFNVSTIAIQVPITALTASGVAPTSATDPNAVIAVYQATSRPQMIAFRTDRSGGVDFSGPLVQVSRLGNPLINELIIPLGMKDRFNASLPGGDAQFLNNVLDPEPARLITLLYNIFVPSPPRNDLATIFLTGIPGVNQQPTTDASKPNAPFNFSAGAANNFGLPPNVTPNERLRLNMATPVTAGTANAQGTPNRLGFLGGDAAGFPNGRRVGDDVVDIELRALAGATPLTPNFNDSPRNTLGDGVNTNDRPFLTRFPYLATPWSGYDTPTAQDSRAVGSTDTTITLPPARPEPTPRP
jgi:hypothetical protein